MILSNFPRGMGRIAPFQPFATTALIRAMSTRPGATVTEALAAKGRSEIAPHRLHVGIFGAMNAGKSSLINMVTQSSISIVDNTPGTTCDVKATTMELHELGPVKLFDTPGLDEGQLLGEKKRAATMALLKDVDVALLVVNPLVKVSHFAKASGLSTLRRQLTETLRYEKMVAATALKYDTELHVVFNTFAPSPDAASHRWLLQDEDALLSVKASVMAHLGLPYEESIDVAMMHFPDERSSRTESEDRHLLLDFVRERHSKRAGQEPEVLPGRFLDRGNEVFLNIPMDVQTPTGRLLRPQAMLQEVCLRNYVTTTAFRMDLGMARSQDPEVRALEEARFRASLDRFLDGSGPGERLLVTDSQAMDLVHPWTLGPDGEPLCDITTFSVVMINHQSKGNLATFADGLSKLWSLGPDDRVLLMEACNHTRITETCADIGLVQIPVGLQKLGVRKENIEHSFGRGIEPAEMKNYDLVIHCGACMLEAQKLTGRVRDCRASGVPITNYGLVLSAFQSKEALERVLRPFGVSSMAGSNGE